MGTPSGLELMKMFFYVKQNATINNSGDFDMPSYELVKAVYPAVTTVNSYIAAVTAAGLACDTEYAAYVKEELHQAALEDRRGDASNE